MGGVLFIDEAYYLDQAENERDYGQEAIEILLQVMENQRDDLVVVLAGYKDRMDAFSSNPGMSSRVAHHIDLPDYESCELEAIGRLMMRRKGLRPGTGGGTGVPATTWTAAARGPGSPTSGPSATPSSAPASARPAGWSRAAVTWVTTTSPPSSRKTSRPVASSPDTPDQRGPRHGRGAVAEGNSARRQGHRD